MIFTSSDEVLVAAASSAAAAVADGLAEQQALVEGAAHGHVVDFHALVVQAEHGHANGGIPDLHAGDDGHDVRLVELVTRKVRVHNDPGNVVKRGGVRIQRVAIDGGVSSVGADVQIAHAHAHGLVRVVGTVDGGRVATHVEHTGVLDIPVAGGGNGSVGMGDDDGRGALPDNLDTVLDFDEGVGNAVDAAG